MKVSVRLLALLISLMMCAMCLAQGGGGQGGGRGGQRGFRGAQMYMSWGGLLRTPEVQTELQLTDDEKTKISDLGKSLRGQGGGGGQGNQLSPEERAARTEDQNKQYEALLTATQITRLHQLRIQWMGDEAVTLKEVQSGLNLSSDQIAKIASIRSDAAAANASVRQKAQDNEIDQPTAAAAYQKNQTTLATELHGVLTPDQVTKLAAMGGAPMAKPAMRFGGRRGGGGQGNGGGAAGGTAPAPAGSGTAGGGN